MFWNEANNNVIKFQVFKIKNGWIENVRWFWIENEFWSINISISDSISAVYIGHYIGARAAVEIISTGSFGKYKTGQRLKDETFGEIF